MAQKTDIIACPPVLYNNAGEQPLTRAFGQEQQSSRSSAADPFFVFPLSCFLLSCWHELENYTTAEQPRSFRLPRCWAWSSSRCWGRKLGSPWINKISIRRRPEVRLQWQFGRLDGSEFLQAAGLIRPLAGQTFPSDPTIWWSSVLGGRRTPASHLCGQWAAGRGRWRGGLCGAGRGGSPHLATHLSRRNTAAPHWPRLWQSWHRAAHPPAIGQDCGSGRDGSLWELSAGAKTGFNGKEFLSRASEISSVKHLNSVFPMSDLLSQHLN